MKIPAVILLPGALASGRACGASVAPFGVSGAIFGSTCSCLGRAGGAALGCFSNCVVRAGGANLGCINICGDVLVNFVVRGAFGLSCVVDSAQTRP